MPDTEKPTTKHIIITKPIGACDRGAPAEPAWRSDSPDFKLNKLGRAS
jgi:hypothetical protein